MIDGPTRQRLIAEAARVLVEQRAAIVGDVRAAVRAEIARQSLRQCLSLVALAPEGGKTEALPMEMDKRYASALIAFICKRPFEGRELDSVLTEPTAALVADVFTRKVAERSDELAEKLVPVLACSRKFIADVAEDVVGEYRATIPHTALAPVSSALGGKFASALMETIDSRTDESIRESILGISRGARNQPLAAQISLALIRNLSASLKPIVASLLGSAALKSAIAAKIKVLVLGAVLGAFVKLVGLKFGLTAGTTLLWIAIPVVLGWIAYEAANFPDHLADRVANGIATDLDRHFTDTSEAMAQALVEQIAADSAPMIARDLIRDPAITTLLDQAIAEAA